jgi:AcrR family transcriptional regulator
MTPRRYAQSRRADSAAATRAAIVDAAVAVYREKGIGGATMKAIADRADVSRGTILNHFGDADGLLDAVLERILASLELPDERILEGIIGRDDRIRAYVAAMVAFFRRSASWWQVFESELERPVVKARETEYWTALSRLQSAALGSDLAADANLQTAIGAVIHPATMGSMLWQLEQGGVGPDRAARIVEDLVLGYVALVNQGSERETS